MKRASPIVKTSDLLMELHNEKKDTVLCVDLFFISGLTFLLSVSRKMNLLIVRYIASKERNSIKLALDKIISTYNSRRFTISAIVCDGCVPQALVHACSTPRSTDIQNIISRYLEI